MDWIVFGDDWGAHPSTTQHLVLHLPTQDSVVWVDSIGMRQPRLRLEDLSRIWQKLNSFVRPSSPAERLYEGSLNNFARIKPKVIPWHHNALARRFNARYLYQAIRRQVRLLKFREPVLLTADPVVGQYLDSIPCRKVVYLRLDDYVRYPGVDRTLVVRTEQEMLTRADLVFATARTLLPGNPFSEKAHYLPQGVRCEHFASVPLDPPGKKILGFFGTIA